MTPSRQERHCSTSSSSSSSSPTTATSSDSETREREDQSKIDSPPVSVSSSNVDDRTGQPVVCYQSRARSPSQPKIPKTKCQRRPTYRNGCKHSEKILWMMEFLNAETHTPVFLMYHLESPRLRVV